MEFTSSIKRERVWPEVIGIRNHIVHGYFDINGYLVFDTIKNDLDALQKAIEYFLQTL